MAQYLWLPKLAQREGSGMHRTTVENGWQAKENIRAQTTSEIAHTVTDDLTASHLFLSRVCGFEEPVRSDAPLKRKGGVDMSTLIRGILPLILFQIAMLAASLGQSATESAATKRGKAIGETINAAITAALPGASAIGNIVKALFPGSSDPTKTSKISPNQVTKAVNDQGTAAQQAAQAQLQALTGAIVEIAATNDLASTAQIANTSMAPARTFLATQDWDNFKLQWAIAKQNLTKIANFDSAKLGKISNEAIQDTWAELNAFYNQSIGDVDNFSASKNLASSLASFDRLANSVQSLVTIPSVQLKLIAQQLSTVKAQVQPPGSLGLAPPPPPPASALQLKAFIHASIATR